MKTTTLLIALTLALVPSLTARADFLAFFQPKADAPAAPAADGPKPPADPAAADAAKDAEPLRVVILAVQGLVRVRQAEDKPWEKATVGMELSQDAEFQTGPKSAVQIKIFPHEVLTLDRLGTIKVLRAIRQNGELKTDVGMQYGRTRYQIQAGGTAHESTIRSPSATLAVRGSDGLAEEYSDRPARYVVFNSPSSSLFGRKGFEFPLGRGQIRVDRRSVADTAVGDGTVDPRYDPALTDPESSRTEQEPEVVGKGLWIGMTRQQILGWTGADRPSFGGASGFNFQPGELKFTITWQGVADVDLDVLDPAGFGTSVFPGVPAGSKRISPTGGIASADDLGPDGMEMITFPLQHLAGNHQVTARLFEFQGSGAATFNLTVTRTLPGGQPTVLDQVNGALDANSPIFTKTVNVPATP